MPSTATITAFYTFSANTKARATQVNNNFDVFRGHIIPISATTATAENVTWDLGSDDYRWRTVKTRSLDLMSNTTTGQTLSIEGLTSGASPAILFKINGTEYFRVQAATGNTTTAGIGQYAISSGFTAGGSFLTGTANMPGTTITIGTSGKPVQLNLMGSTGGSGSFVLSGLTNTINNIQVYLVLKRDNVEIQNWQYALIVPTGTSAPIREVNFGAINYLDFVPAGTYVYNLSYQFVGSNVYGDFSTVLRLIAKENTF